MHMTLPQAKDPDRIKGKKEKRQAIVIFHPSLYFLLVAVKKPVFLHCRLPIAGSSAQAPEHKHPRTEPFETARQEELFLQHRQLSAGVGYLGHSKANVMNIYGANRTSLHIPDRVIRCLRTLPSHRAADPEFKRRECPQSVATKQP